MFSRIRSVRAGDMAIDLGTANTLVYVKGRGIVLNEPSVVAIVEQGDKKKLLAVGHEANRMIGRTPGHIRAVRPMRNGMIGDFEVAEEMIKYFIQRIYGRRRMTGLGVVVSVPSGATPVERRAVQEAAESAGARRVYLIEEPMAAAIGANLPVTDPVGSMVVDIGGGTTGIAVLSLGGVVLAQTLQVAGYRIDEMISASMRRSHNMAIGEATAERIKHEIGSAMPPEDGEGHRIEVKGLDLVHGIPRAVVVSQREIAESFAEAVGAIVHGVKLTLERTAPEVAADIIDRGIVLTGGGALLGNLDRVLHDATGLPVHIAEDPLTCGARGAGRVLEEMAPFQSVLQA